MCGDAKYYARLWKKQAAERRELEKEAEKYISHNDNYYVSYIDSNNTPKSPIDEAGVNVNVGMPCLQEVRIRMIWGDATFLL